MWDEVPPTSNRLGKEQKENHESPSDSSEHHRCTHVDVHHQKVTRNVATNVNKNLLQMIGNLHQYNHPCVLSSNK